LDGERDFKKSGGKEKRKIKEKIKIKNKKT